MNTKIFCDSADYKTISRLNKNKLVSGFTTNPSLMRNAGAKSYKLYSQKILKFATKSQFHSRSLLMIKKVCLSKHI